MQNSLVITKNRKFQIALMDIIAIAFIYLVPTISHMLSFPLYLIEPMRIMLILALVHTRRENAYFLALTLPFISYIFSGHPVLIKTFLISAELLVNVFFFYLVLKLVEKKFIAALTSIIFAKSFYYGNKILLISLGVFSGELISTPVWLQIIMTLLLSGYIFIFFKKE